MFILTHTPTGSAYTLDDGALISTPLYEDLTFDTAIENWVEVEERSQVQDGLFAICLQAQFLDPEFVDNDDF
jgi:hypothetical protein